MKNICAYLAVLFTLISPSLLWPAVGARNARDRSDSAQQSSTPLAAVSSVSIFPETRSEPLPNEPADVNGAAEQAPASVEADNPEVAEVSGKKLTLADLNGKKAGSLLQARYQYYLSERKILDQLVDDQLLETRARAEGMTVDQFLDKRIYRDIKDPTEDQLEVYYEGVESDEPFSAVREKILDHIRQLRRDKARAAYLKSLRADAHIRILLAPPAIDVDTKNAYVHGEKDAPVTLVEFADYECPYCQKMNADVQKLQEQYGSKLAIVFKDFPLPMHKRAEKAAEAARCAGEQGKFWEYHDVLFYSRLLDVPDLKKHAAVLRLDQARFDKCLDSGAEAAAVKKDFEQGKALGLTGTPSFFANGHFFSGAVEYSTLEEIVDQQLVSPTLAAAHAGAGK